MSALVWQGVATMTPERYAVLASLVGPWLEEYRDSPIWIGEDSGNERRAIYIPVNGEGVACYCGRTRPERALCGGAASVPYPSAHGGVQVQAGGVVGLLGAAAPRRYPGCRGW